MLNTFADTAATDFAGPYHVQLPLSDAHGAPRGRWPWTLMPYDLRQDLATCTAAGVDLKVMPWHFQTAGLRALLDLGVRWYATDGPTRFAVAVTV